METFLEVTISKEEVKKVLNSIEAMKLVLDPYLAKLSPDERIQFPKLTPNKIEFIKKSIDFTVPTGKLTPGSTDIEELRSDYETIRLLSQIIEPLKQLCHDLGDTILLSGREAYNGSLNYYYSIEEESNVNAEAKAIYRELSASLDKAEG
jgi:hypothetical protein